MIKKVQKHINIKWQYRKVIIHKIIILKQKILKLRIIRMGNEANCKKFCDHQQQPKHQLSQIKMNQYPLQCQICHKQIEHINFKRHLDHSHYASIQQKNLHISVVCLLCDLSSESLEFHQSHLLDKHSYSIISQDQNDNKSNASKQIITYKLIKAKLKQIQSLGKLRLIKQLSQNVWQVQYEQKQYKMYKKSKQYDGMSYDQVEVFAELVLHPVFSQYKSLAKYYYLQKNALQKSIQCTSFIICLKQ